MKAISLTLANSSFEILILSTFTNRTEVYRTPTEIHGCVCIALIKTLPKVFEATLNQAITKADCKESSKDFFVSTKLGIRKII